jgi:PPOX class probable F420-dependent enzyme
MSSVLSRLYDTARHRSAQSVADDQRIVHGFEQLRGHKYCVLVTYKRSGEPVPTPVWFGLADGKLYVRSEAAAAKVRRVRNDPRVRVAPCTVRGKPLGPPAEGRATLLDQPAQEQRAEDALKGNYGPGRKLYKAAGGALSIQTVYLEIAPT